MWIKSSLFFFIFGTSERGQCSECSSTSSSGKALTNSSLWMFQTCFAPWCHLPFLRPLLTYNRLLLVVYSVIPKHMGKKNNSLASVKMKQNLTFIQILDYEYGHFNRSSSSLYIVIN